MAKEVQGRFLLMAFSQFFIYMKPNACISDVENVAKRQTIHCRTIKWLNAQFAVGYRRSPLRSSWKLLEHKAESQ